MLTLPLSARRWSSINTPELLLKGGSVALFCLCPNHTGKHPRVCVSVTYWLEHYIAIIGVVGSKLKFSFRILKTLVVCDSLMSLCSPTAAMTGTSQWIMNCHLQEHCTWAGLNKNCWENPFLSIQSSSIPLQIDLFQYLDVVSLSEG